MPVTGSSMRASPCAIWTSRLRFYRDALGLNQQFDKVIDADYLRTILAMLRSRASAPSTSTFLGGGVIELLEYRGLRADVRADPGGRLRRCATSASTSPTSRRWRMR